MSGLEAKIAALRGTEWFKTADEPIVSALASRMLEVEYGAGVELLKEDDVQSRFFVVVSGSLRRCKHGVCVDEGYGEGSVSGLLHVFRGDPVYATVSAGPQGVKVLEMSRASLQEMLSDSSLSMGLLSALAGRLRGFVRQNIGEKATEGPNKHVIALFDAKPYERDAFSKELESFHAGGKNSVKLEIRWIEQRLSETTASLASGCSAVCIFVNDVCNATVVDTLKRLGIRVIALRCAGYNNVDLVRTAFHAIPVVRVPAYSPYAVAEHAAALMLTLNRKTHLAYARTRDNNFALRGLTGFDMHGKMVGVVGTGKIGKCLVDILLGFGCKVVLYDAYPDRAYAAEKGIVYATLDQIWASCDIVSFHVPLLPSTTHMVNAESIARMRRGVMLINTSRGGIVDTRALIDGLRSGQVGYAGLDVYEDERSLFFEDHSQEVLSDDTLAVLTSFRNVLLTGHQAFLTNEALQQIASVTVANLDATLVSPSYETSQKLPNFVRQEFA